MKTVPLHGAKAAGRVVRVDDEDYELVMQHRWFVHEKPATATKRKHGPYATANPGGRTILMHNLIMDVKGIDHRDHDGLNNQRSNLREATHAQNMHNTRAHQNARSPLKGVTWSSRKRTWLAQIKPDGRKRHLGYFRSELEAAYAYDAAAREHFGEFACTNFPEGPTQAMRDEWQADREVRSAGNLSALGARSAEWWVHREVETRVCTICGSEYQTRSSRSTFYCGGACKAMSVRRRKKERELVRV